MEDNSRKTDNEAINDMLMNSDEISNYAFRSSLVNSWADILKDYDTSYKYSASEIRDMLNDPYENNKKLQTVAKWLFLSDGTFREILQYKVGMLTYDHFMIPRDYSKVMGKKGSLEANELKSATRLERFNLKHNLPNLMLRTLLLGEMFIYQVDNNKGDIVLQELPSERCEIIKNVNNVYKYGIYLTAIDKNEIKYYPKSIQRAWRMYKDGVTNDKVNELGFFDMSDDKNAYAFSINYNGYNCPYYANLMFELMDWKKLKDMYKRNGEMDAFKLVVQKIPTDSEGKLLIKSWDIQAYHEAMKNVLPRQIKGVTTPMNIEAVNFGNTNKTTNDFITDARKIIYDTAGVNDEIFNGEKSSNEAISISVIADTLMPLMMLSQFQCWINDNMLNHADTKYWMVKLLDVTRYDREKRLQTSINSLTTWTSKKKHIALCGFTPLEGINMLKFEYELNMDMYMTPLSTAFTQSGKDNGDEGGRPSNEDNTESTTNTGASESDAKKK